MRPKVFLSHNSKDKPFVRRLADDLEAQGINYWLDEAELDVGDSLIEKIQDGIDNVQYVAIILSENSISSRWVQKEMSVALTLEIEGYEIKVLPLMLDQVKVPTFLIDKKYLNFTTDDEYKNSLSDLVKGMGLVFSERAYCGEKDASSMWDAQNKALHIGLPFLRAPFHRPHQYVGMKADEAFDVVKGERNKVGNIIVENNDVHMFLEREGAYISYVEVDIKSTKDHPQDQSFDPDPFLGCVSINTSELEKVRTQTHAHTYYDHKRKLKILVMNNSDDIPISISFGSKYYGM